MPHKFHLLKWTSPGLCVHVRLHFLLLFPVSQWKTQRGEAWRWNAVQSLKGQHWETLAGVQQLWCIYDNTQLYLVLLNTGCRFSVTEKKRQRDMKCVGCQGQFVSLCPDSFYSANVAITKPYSEAAANGTMSACGLCPDSWIVQCKWKLDLITA